MLNLKQPKEMMTLKCHLGASFFQLPKQLCNSCHTFPKFSASFLNMDTDTRCSV